METKCGMDRSLMPLMPYGRGINYNNHIYAWQQVNGYLWVLLLSPSIKLIAMI